EGSELSHFGKSASTKNGVAKAVANASMPIADQNHSPWVAATSTVPTKAAVQVNEVRVKVRPISSVAASVPRCERESRLERSFDGTRISNIPKRLSANITKSAVRKRFIHGLAATLFTPAGPAMSVNASPRPAKVKMIPKQYMRACLTAAHVEPCWFLVKKETVIGIIGKTQGVSNARSPNPIASQI